VSYFAAAVARGPAGGWTAAEVDLSGVADVDEVADRLRDVEPDADVAILFVESDDLYLAILRLDEGEDLRIFASDSAFAEESRLGTLLIGELEPPALDIEEPIEAGEDDDDEEAEKDEEPDRPPLDADADPVGDADLLADLGIPAPKLLALCAHEGLMPADVTAEVCQILGCGDEVEELREA
jgi:putative tRNA adenosine deaminase-associated protein